MSLKEKLPWIDKRPREYQTFSTFEQKTLGIVGYNRDWDNARLFSQLLLIADTNDLPLVHKLEETVESFKALNLIETIDIPKNGFKEFEYYKLSKRGKDALFQIGKTGVAYLIPVRVRILSETSTSANR